MNSLVIQHKHNTGSYCTILIKIYIPYLYCRLNALIFLTYVVNASLQLKFLSSNKD